MQSMATSVNPPWNRARYLDLVPSGELTKRAADAAGRLAHCELCPRRCGADRHRSAQQTFCGIGAHAVVYSFGAHHGEEDCLTGRRGSGTIFFSGCNLRCAFCQNWEISQRAAGREMEPNELAAVMLALQARGCHNINLVSPSHVVAAILAAVDIAARQGLELPLVYNTGGYDRLETLQLLDGIVDIYMPDMKYGRSDVAHRCSQAGDYVEVNFAAVKEMHRQVGDLVLGDDGVARRGLLVRHLVLPGGLAGSMQVLDFLAAEVSPNTFINIMGQYHPCYLAGQEPPLDKRPTAAEYREAVRGAQQRGFLRLDRRLSGAS
jgi:putative pyruvate formate lyase activating enzyme